MQAQKLLVPWPKDGMGWAFVHPMMGIQQKVGIYHLHNIIKLDDYP
jgi:hypothetical protein